MANVGSELSIGWRRGIVRSRAGIGLAVLGLGLAASGCFTAQLDPDLPGVFVCGDDDDDEGACPASLVCINARCEDPELAPSVAVLDPEEEQSLERVEAVDLVMGQPPPMLAPLEIRIQGSISLVSASAEAEPVFGEGYVTVSVDGVEQRTIDEGSLGGSTPVTVEVPMVTGPHRIVLRAYRSDGVAYDNPEATAVRLFWIERVRGLQPFVAIKSPLPGTAFDLGDQTLDVEVATLNFQLLDPGGPVEEGRGHAHIYYEERLRFPACVQDPGCDSGYLGVVGESMVGELPMPAAPAGTGVITAVLRKADHSPYGFPFVCDPASDVLGTCSPVFDAIDVARVEDEDD